MRRSPLEASAPTPALVAIAAVAAVAALGALAALAQGCAGESLAAPRYCEPGATQLCTCTSGQQGVQICNDIGQSWLACSCASTPSAPTADGAAPSFDGAPSTPPPDAGATAADSSVDSATTTTPPPPPGTQSCAEVDQCVIKCAPDDIGCQQACIVKGSASARTAALALLTCAKNARAGVCKLMCSTGGSGGAPNLCNSCVDNACSQQVSACYGP